MSTAGSAIPYLVASVSHQLDQRLAAALAGLPLTVRQFGVLDTLRAAPHSSAAELARRSLVTRQTMNGLLRQLESMHAIAPTDRRHGRTVGLQLTGQGLDLHRRATRIADEVELAALGWMAPAERDQLAGLLRRMRDRMGGTDGGP